MQGLTKANKTINRGITAVAMTVAIATLYAATPSHSRVIPGDVLKHQMQALLKFNQPKEGIPQPIQDSQESLATLFLSFDGGTYSHQ